MGVLINSATGFNTCAMGEGKYLQNDTTESGGSKRVALG